MLLTPMVSNVLFRGKVENERTKGRAKAKNRMIHGLNRDVFCVLI